MASGADCNETSLATKIEQIGEMSKMLSKVLSENSASNNAKAHIADPIDNLTKNVADLALAISEQNSDENQESTKISSLGSVLTSIHKNIIVLNSTVNLLIVEKREEMRQNYVFQQYVMEQFQLISDFIKNQTTGIQLLGRNISQLSHSPAEDLPQPKDSNVVASMQQIDSSFKDLPELKYDTSQPQNFFTFQDFTEPKFGTSFQQTDCFAKSFSVSKSDTPHLQNDFPSKDSTGLKFDSPFQQADCFSKGLADFKFGTFQQINFPSKDFGEFNPNTQFKQTDCFSKADFKFDIPYKENDFPSEDVTEFKIDASFSKITEEDLYDETTSPNNLSVYTKTDDSEDDDSDEQKCKIRKDKSAKQYYNKFISSTFNDSIFDEAEYACQGFDSVAESFYSLNKTATEFLPLVRMYCKHSNPLLVKLAELMEAYLYYLSICIEYIADSHKLLCDCLKYRNNFIYFLQFVDSKEEDVSLNDIVICYNTPDIDQIDFVGSVQIKGTRIIIGNDECENFLLETDISNLFVPTVNYDSGLAISWRYKSKVRVAVLHFQRAIDRFNLFSRIIKVMKPSVSSSAACDYTPTVREVERVKAFHLPNHFYDNQKCCDYYNV